MRRLLLVTLLSVNSGLLPISASESVEFYLERSPDLSVAHLKCLSRAANFEEYDSSEDEWIRYSKEGCCKEILYQILGACSQYDSMRIDNTWVDDSMHDFCAASFGSLSWSSDKKQKSFQSSFLRKCSSVLASVPFPFEDTSRHRVKSYYMSAPIFHPSKRNSDVYMVDRTLRKYHEQDGTHEWIDIRSPFLERISPSENNCHVNASLSSKFSTDGGMQRAFSQSIQMKGIIPHKISDRNATSILSGIFQLHLPIARETFLDLDDPFQDDMKHACQVFSSTMKDSTTCSVKIISSSDDGHKLTSQKQYIDIEQPAFDSSQHVLLLQLDFSMKIDHNTQSFDVIFRFSPVIHIRYQMPLSRTANQKKVQLYIPSPYFYMAEISLLSKSDYVIYDENFSACFHRNIECTSVSNQSSNTLLYPIYIESATGYDHHHDYVVIVTTLASLLGTWILLRSMSRVSIWI